MAPARSALKVQGNKPNDNPRCHEQLAHPATIRAHQEPTAREFPRTMNLPHIAQSRNSMVSLAHAQNPWFRKNL